MYTVEKKTEMKGHRERENKRERRKEREKERNVHCWNPATTTCADTEVPWDTEDKLSWAPPEFPTDNSHLKLLICSRGR
jgi:hypothetical protein